MMQWKKGDTGFDTTEDRSDSPHAYTSRDGRGRPTVLLNHVIVALATILSRVGLTSLALALALVIATVLFGLLANDAVALGQWCRKC